MVSKTFPVSVPPYRRDYETFFSSLLGLRNSRQRIGFDVGVEAFDPSAALLSNNMENYDTLCTLRRI